MHVCVWLSPFAVHLKLSQYGSSAIPLTKIKSFFKKSKKKKKKKSRFYEGKRKRNKERKTRQEILSARWRERSEKYIDYVKH